MTATKEQFQTISKIADRALAEFGPAIGDKLSVVMDLEFTHDAIPLRLDELLDADLVNFVHDIAGIHNNFNRETKQMDNCFHPRFAA